VRGARSRSWFGSPGAARRGFSLVEAGDRLNGRLEVITGPVYSGKTSELSRQVRREQIAGLRAVVLQSSAHDERRLRTAARLPDLGVAVHPVRTAADVRTLVDAMPERPEVVALDNAHELDLAAASVCDALASSGLRVLAAGLDQRADGRAYPTMGALLALGDVVQKLGAVCPVAVCRERATRSQALADPPTQRLLFEDRFEPRCPDHFRPYPLPRRRGRRQRSGRVTVYAGCMFAGKTQDLLTHYDRLLGGWRRVQMVKPRIDQRYALADVVTHDGVHARSRPLETADDLTRLCERRRRPHAVFVDEAQFLPGILEVAETLVQAGIDVIIAALDLNYRGEPWPGIPELLARADTCVKLHAICPGCYQAATRTRRLTSDRAEIAIGGPESYAPACRSCFRDQ
jgi:thymidine kinase